MSVELMDLKSIHEFVVLADIKNFARAADILYTTQATLSRHIISLEKELGKPLFNRTTRKVELTDFGLSFLPFAKCFVQTWEECEAYLLTESRHDEDRVVIGISGPILDDIAIKSIFSKFCLSNPDCNLEITQDDEEEQLLNRLRRKELDMAILREPVSISDSFRRFTISPEEALCVLLPKDHPLANANSVLLDDLKDEYFLPPPSRTHTYRLVVERCRHIGFEPKIRTTLRDRETIVSMASNGIGIPVLSYKPAIAVASDAVFVVKIYPPIHQTVNIVYPKLSKLSRAPMQLLDFFEKNSDALARESF
jgi:DNA-binding transcriptional LysR family regulator